MNTNIKILIGSAIGGAFGYFVGSVIVEIIQIKNEKILFEEEQESQEEVVPTKMKRKRKEKEDRSQERLFFLRKIQILLLW